MFFCQQLAEWLYTSTWHFTTLLAIVVEKVDGIPAKEDEFVNALLLAHPSKPAKKQLTAFIHHYFGLRGWLRHKPRLASISLRDTTSRKLVDERLPILGSTAKLCQFLGITDRELDWFTQRYRFDAKEPEHFHHYHYSLCTKRDGSARLLESPKSHLKSIQRRVQREILSRVEMHPAAHGFINGRSCKTHAEPHTNKKYLFVFDLRQCFQSTQWHQVYSVFDQLGYPDVVCKSLTMLCTHKSYLHHPLLKPLPLDERQLLKERHLPQGAPSSPSLSNAVLRKLDTRLVGLASALGFEYTRYADDLAFSGNKIRNWGFLEPLVSSICLDEGFQMNHRKSRLMRSHQRQKITGVVVNQRVNVDRRYYDQLKATLHNCVRDGLVIQNRMNHPNFKSYLYGSIQYVKSLNVKKGEKLEKIYLEIQD